MTKKRRPPAQAALDELLEGAGPLTLATAVLLTERELRDPDADDDEVLIPAERWGIIVALARQVLKP